MGNLTNITTQSALGDANFLLQEFANNLGAHSNTSLSTSHGIDTFPVLNTDPDNNNRTNFEDALGNTVGTRHLRFIVAGINYWVPGQDTGLAGKPPGTNITDLQGVANTGLGAGDDNWVTTFEQTAANNISVVNTNYLLPHVKLAHWETHGNITATAEFTYNALGYEVGNTVLKLSIDGTVYKIPAHTRFGGPAQWWVGPKVSTDPGVSYANIAYMVNHDESKFGIFYYKDQSPYKGTLPRKIKWQINESPYGNLNWYDIPVGGGLPSTFVNNAGGTWWGNPGVAFGGYNISKTAPRTTVSNLTVSSPAGDNWAVPQVVVRVKAIGNYGSSPNRITYTNLCQFVAEDQPRTRKWFQILTDPLGVLLPGQQADNGYYTYYSGYAYGLFVPMQYVGYRRYVSTAETSDKGTLADT